MKMNLDQLIHNINLQIQDSINNKRGQNNLIQIWGAQTA